MSDSIILTLTKEEATTADFEAVVARLGRALHVEGGVTGVLVGSIDQAETRVAINRVDKAMTVAIRERHGEKGLVIAATAAMILKLDLVGADGSPLPASVQTVTRLLGRALSDEGKVLAEKLGLILPRLASKRAVNF